MSTESKTKRRLHERVADFSTPTQVRERLRVLEAMQFRRKQHGIGARNLEVNLLNARLTELSNPPLIP
jgi:hypothetical protein